MQMQRIVFIGAAGVLLGGLMMGAAPRVVAPKAATKAALNPFEVTAKAPAAAARADRGDRGQSGTRNPNTNPGGWDNDPPGKAVRKNRPPVRPGHRPPPRSKHRPGKGPKQ